MLGRFGLFELDGVKRFLFGRSFRSAGGWLSEGGGG